MLDSSGSVGSNNFQRMKLFVKDLADYYKLGLEETRVSVMSFSDSAYIHIPFSRYFSDKNQFDSAVDEISYSGGGTATAIALNISYNHMFTSRYGARGKGKGFGLYCFKPWISSCVPLPNRCTIYAIFLTEFFISIFRDQKSFGDLDGWSK